MSINTFGGNYDRGEGSFLLVPFATGGIASTDKVIAFAKNNLGNPYFLDNFQNASQIGIAWGVDKFLILGYSATPFVREQRHTTKNSFVRGAEFDDSYTNIDPASPITDKYPFQISYANGIWMITCINSTNTVGNIFVSSDGTNWTKYAGVIPAYIGNPTPPIYNQDNGRWCFAISGTTRIFYSDNNGQSWTERAISAACYGLSYGNGVWLFAAGANNVRSTNNLSSFTTSGAGLPVVYSIHYNKYDQRFWAGSGNYNGTNYEARIGWSVDGVTWNTVYNSTASLFVMNIIGDDNGNMVAVGHDYRGAFVATVNYLYSTNAGASWTAGTLPAAKYTPFGFTQLAYGSMKIGTPPVGNPPFPTYTISADRSSVNEGNTVNWTLNTTNVADGTTLYYTYVVTPTSGFSDFTENTYASSFVVNNNTATFQKTIASDSATEGTETVVLQIKTGSISGTPVVSSQPVTIYDTSVYVPPEEPSQAHPVITAGAAQSFSVPRSVYKNESIQYTIQLTNNTPYSYTVDIKQVGSYLTFSDGDVRATITLNGYTVLNQVFTETFPTGYTAAAAPNFNQTLAVAARGAPGTPNRYTLNVSRTPYNVSVSPTSGSSVRAPPITDIVFSGGEPNSYLSYTGATTGRQQFNSSGSYSFYNITTSNNLPYTDSWTITLSDGSSFPYSITYTN